jgi:hypothetical protein
LDRFCIGQSIKDARFNQVEWITPREGLSKETCTGIGCKPQNAFRGYPNQEQMQLTDALTWIYGLGHYNLLTRQNLDALRHYRYECNPSARGLVGGERRFLGLYWSVPSHYLTVVGLRLIGDDLKVYRIARQYPYQNPSELISLAHSLRDQYGDRILLYDYLSSNAYSDVIEQGKNGWFGRSTMFNPRDLSDNAAELVLIDPITRSLLEPSSMPESGEIKPLAFRIPAQCNKAIPIQ